MVLALSLGLVGVLRRRLLVRLLLGFLAVGLGVARHAKRGEKLAHEPRVGALVEQGVAQPVEIGAGLLLDKRAPELDETRRAARRLESGQALARQHRDRVFERRLLARARVGEGAAVVTVVEHRGDVRGHALHAARTDGFDPRLLDRVEQGARRRALRRVTAMDRVAVASEPQGEQVGETPNDRGLARIGLARRLRQPRLGAFRPGDERGLVG